ncbi:hypothetical protein [Bradyrhizobium guangzhouense]|uniref:hypothetical protein n=1 Tax=Bradyrhizobium guangzhouense TaxID=1325095 RepID=UPI001FE0D796|nr:hypothetical protein [Bradyrhizobium guangzhouense]
MGTSGTTTGVHTNTSATNPNVQQPTPNGTAPSNGASQHGIYKSGITATNGANNNNGKGGQQMTPAEQARTGAKTLPSSETPGAVSGPGVGVGHAANGLPIGTPGSGTSNVDQKLGRSLATSQSPPWRAFPSPEQGREPLTLAARSPCRR